MRVILKFKNGAELEHVMEPVPAVFQMRVHYENELLCEFWFRGAFETDGAIVFKECSKAEAKREWLESQEDQ